jgi:hypothetical protein
MVFFTWSKRYLRDGTIEEQLLEVSPVKSMRYGRRVICIQPHRILRDLSMYRAARATLLANCKPFSSQHWAVYRLLILCQYRMRGSPYFKGEICLWAFSVGLLPSRPKFLIFRIPVTVSWWSYSSVKTSNRMSILKLLTPPPGVSLVVQVPGSGLNYFKKLRLC